MRQRTVSIGGSEPANRPGPRAQGRRTNLALLVLLISAFATGLTTQALGTPLVGGWMAIVHGVVGLSVVLLAPWKTRVAQRGIARQNRKRALSLLMALLAVILLATGILHSIGVPNPHRPLHRALGAFRHRSAHHPAGDLACLGPKDDATSSRCVTAQPHPVGRSGLGGSVALVERRSRDRARPTAGHGFPARLVAPDRRGFWWVKWVVRIETSNVPWWVQSPYPLS